MISVLLLAVAFALDAASGIYDATLTSRGLKAGVAVEGNTWLIGTKPSNLALHLRNIMFLVASSLPAALALYFGNIPVAMGFLAGPAVDAYKHIAGGRAWAALLRKK